MKPLCALITLAVACTLQAQDTTASAQAKPTEHVIGTVTETNPANHTVTVKEDGKEVVYYFDADTNKMFPHRTYCKGTKEAKVTITKTEEKDGKKYATITKIEEK